MKLVASEKDALFDTMDIQIPLWTGGTTKDTHFELLMYCTHARVLAAQWTCAEPAYSNIIPSRIMCVVDVI